MSNKTRLLLATVANATLVCTENENTTGAQYNGFFRDLFPDGVVYSETGNVESAYYENIESHSIYDDFESFPLCKFHAYRIDEDELSNNHFTLVYLVGYDKVLWFTNEDYEKFQAVFDAMWDKEHPEEVIG